MKPATTITKSTFHSNPLEYFRLCQGRIQRGCIQENTEYDIQFNDSKKHGPRRKIKGKNLLAALETHCGTLRIVNVLARVTFFNPNAVHP